MIVGKDYIFVENPKTASKSVREVLLAAGGVEHGHQHFSIREFDSLQKKRLRAVVVRNPFDRLVSGWHYATKGEGDFNAWVMGLDWVVAPGIDFKRTSQLHWTCQCNFVMRFEELQSGVSKLSERIGIEKQELPHLHKSQDRKAYQEYYNEKAKAAVSDRFAMDLLKLDYRF